MTIHPIQDQLSFQLRADKVVTNDTVKITTTVTTLAGADTTEATLRANIREVLGKFIDADWKFSNIVRFKDDSGYEKVTLTAFCRVSEKENYNLESRAAAVSREGLQLKDINPDISVPQHLLDEADKELRLLILKNALVELEDIKKISGREYRLNNISYNNQTGTFDRKNYGGGGNATIASLTSYGNSMDGSDDGLSNSAKVTLTANVILAVVV